MRVLDHNLPADQAQLLFKVLADPVRLSVIEALGAGERCVCEITGELGLAYSSPVPARDIDRLVKTGKVTLETRGYENAAWTVTAEFNQRREHVKRREVRQAILHAINRQFIVDTIYYGRGKPAIARPLPRGTLGGGGRR
jgi:ABC-type transport system substrate-binding protein